LQLIHPIVSGFLSFVVPWTLLFFNKEVAALLKKVFEAAVPVRAQLPSASWTTGVK
uniref:Anoctamin n=1 Tax=Haemonchus placei TaxID=6290 RepID=A0A0N4VWF4_HAEPC